MKTDRDGRQWLYNYISGSHEDPLDWNVPSAAYELAQLNDSRGSKDRWDFETLEESDISAVLCKHLVTDGHTEIF